MEMVETVSENDPIRKFQAELQDASRRAERLRPVLNACNDAIERSGVKAAISVGSKSKTSPQVEVMIVIKSLNETIPLFRELAKEGLKTDKSDAHKDHNLFEVFAMREYNCGPDLIVLATIIGSSKDGDGPSCRMEKVGTKEVPVYEMRCD